MPIDFLKSVPLFAEFERGELEGLFPLLVETRFEPGQLILEEGQPNRALHLVREGRVRVSRQVEGNDVFL